MYRLSILLFLALSSYACSGPTMHNPNRSLKEIGKPSSLHIKAMELLDIQVGIDNSAYKKQLQRMLWVLGYTIEAREAALQRLWASDQEGTIRTLRQQLPRINNLPWLNALCTWIGDLKIMELNEALISSWANPMTLVRTEKERPEYIALVKMHGNERITDLIFESMLSTNKAWKQGYITRCWELLHRLDQRERLLLLLEQTEFARDNTFFLDLQRTARELGIVPHRREEILWIRELSKPMYDSFWQEAIQALAKLDQTRRNEIELRDVPIAVSLLRHGGENAFDRSTQSILHNVDIATKHKSHYVESEGGGIYNAQSESLKTHRNELTWGDAITLEILLTALEVPEVRSHLFDYANRDLLDETTEYGGVIALDKKGRFEILEFEPKIRTHDRRFNAPQDMFDAAYTALFHFHFHAQKLRNGDHAGPGMGDKNYANNTRANCLVFTYINEETMNVDYYRHGGIVIDVGTISKQ